MADAKAKIASDPIPMLDLRAQYATLREEIRAALDEVLEAQQFILGPQGKALEDELSRFCGARFAVGVASGTDALILALHAAGVRPGDEVIVPAFTYVATADAVSLLGAKPVFADILPGTFNIDPQQIEKHVTPRTKATVPVHLFGQAADMDPVLALAARRGLHVIEDNAQAIGANYRGRTTGTMGETGTLSFFPTKNLGGYGDGGMILTNSPDLERRLRSLRFHGTGANRYISDEQGWNSRLDELQAAVLRVKLRHLQKWNAARQEHAARYNALLKNVPGLTTPSVAASCEHVFHQYTMRISGGGAARRDAVQKKLAARGIASTVYYPIPLHLQPMFAALGHKAGDFPHAERAATEVLSLPIYPELLPAQIERVAEALAAALREESGG
ncbi:MAG: DegT/DnrJ/EryC1/StrS family aminotransferase [Acidobacteria bacterium]|nr:DegT/DnrJ/EryC1/StrS family aminotransferase [Acidobacteriota bacterium]MCL5289214.1 DegT/DnrJ/EryC1/StrS family aminotransferase [Acidobacteriota bacterium]